MKRNKTLLNIVSLLMIVLILSGCGGSGVVPDTTPPDTSSELVLVKVTDPDSNLLFVVGQENEDAMAILGDKDIQGNPTDLTGAVYVSEQGDSFGIVAGEDGLPSYLIDSEGNKVIFENYTNSTVEISIYDSNGNLVQDSITLSLDPEDLSELKQLYNSFNLKGARWSSENTQTAIKWGSVGLSAIGCGVALYGTAQTGGALALTGAVAWACSKFLLSAAAALTPTDIDNGVSYAISSGSCILSVGQDASSCISAIGSTIDYGLGAPPNKPPEIFELSADPSSVNTNETTQITCYAYDPDGDLVKYWWTSTGGKFEGNNNTVGPSIYWEAPSTEGNYIITCVAYDGKGGEAEDNVTIPVSGENNEGEEEIQNVLEKFNNAMNNENWVTAKQCCVSNSQAYNFVQEYQSNLNQLYDMCDQFTYQCNDSANDPVITISGSNATATISDSSGSCIMTCVIGTEDFTIDASGSGSEKYYLEKIGGVWLISDYEGAYEIEYEEI